ncbi:uncharacterized protein KY384_000440 [Bacidia gigantensis]|uniref:uncharacterized protein n=1 Tax=Bacidia gigantensis TaxID=2732470 RepID=UPI001D03F03F|nr:uncharacterized protein KY384_000440 [Bacidia gigantensis]KAG8525680.1 hypothetical protein KY384_000440 [Bacidia gigantensis]
MARFKTKKAIQRAHESPLLTIPLEIRFLIFDLIFLGSPEEDTRGIDFGNRNEPANERRNFSAVSDFLPDGTKVLRYYPQLLCFIFCVNRQLHDEFIIFIDTKGFKTQQLELRHQPRMPAEALHFFRSSLSYPGIQEIRLLIRPDRGYQDLHIVNWIVMVVYILQQVVRLTCTTLQVEIDAHEQDVEFRRSPRSPIVTDDRGDCKMSIDIKSCEVEQGSGYLDQFLRKKTARALNALKKSDTRRPSANSSQHVLRAFKISFKRKKLIIIDQ